MIYDLHLDPFERRHVGEHGAFTLRVNREHVKIARAAAALRQDMPVSDVAIDWTAVRGSVAHEVVQMPKRRKFG